MSTTIDDYRTGKYARNMKTGALRKLGERDVLRDGEEMYKPILMQDGKTVSDASPGSIYLTDTTTVMDVAKQFFPDSDLQGLKEHELRRKVATAVVGEDKTERQPDSFIDGVFRNVAADPETYVSIAKSRQEREAQAVADTDHREGLQVVSDTARSEVEDARARGIADISTAWMTPDQRPKQAADAGVQDNQADAYEAMKRDLSNAWQGGR